MSRNSLQKGIPGPGSQVAASFRKSDVGRVFAEKSPRLKKSLGIAETEKTFSLAGVAVEAAACPHGAVAGVSSTFQPWSTLAHIAASGAVPGATSGAAPGDASALALVASIPMAPY